MQGLACRATSCKAGSSSGERAGLVSRRRSSLAGQPAEPQGVLQGGACGRLRAERAGGGPRSVCHEAPGSGAGRAAGQRRAAAGCGGSVEQRLAEGGAAVGGGRERGGLAQRERGKVVLLPEVPRCDLRWALQQAQQQHCTAHVLAALRDAGVALVYMLSEMQGGAFVGRSSAMRACLACCVRDRVAHSWSRGRPALGRRPRISHTTPRHA